MVVFDIVFSCKVVESLCDVDGRVFDTAVGCWCSGIS